MSEKLKIKELRFKAGSKPCGKPLTVELPSVTVLVGPNNSGKSLALREIENWCAGKQPVSNVLDGIEIEWPGMTEEFIGMLRSCEVPPPEGQMPQEGVFWVGRPGIRHGEDVTRQQINEGQAKRWFMDKTSPHLQQIFVRLFTLRLDGRTRFQLVDPKEAGSLEDPPRNHLWALFVDDEAREKVRQFTEDAFGTHFVIDPTGMKVFRIRLSSTKPSCKTEEQGLDERSRKFHQRAALIMDLGDGVKASVGLVSAVMSLPHKILLVDEPEAFLHPPLARRVGKTLSEIAQQRDATLVAATHSADFLMGCLQSTTDLRLVRLTYAQGKATARSLEPVKVLGLMQDPLLRSTNVLRALFHNGAVVTEADTDRAFYDEINARLLATGRGCEDTLFMNAQNWQTVPRIVEPLRDFGIPAAMILDFDVLMSKEFQKIWGLLKRCVAPAELEELQRERKQIKKLMERVGRNSFKTDGVAAFGGNDKKKVVAFLKRMQQYGIFFVPVGELERWLQTLHNHARIRKDRWLTETFEKLGSDPNADEYVRPGGDGVWQFMDDVACWINDSQRKGMPD